MTDIFENGKPKEEGTPAVATPQEGVSSTDTYLGLITNEDGTQKYATAEEALKGSVHAQTHITKLESELKELRDKNTKNVDMEQLLEALNSKKPDDNSGEKPQALTAEDIATQVEGILVSRENVQTTESNVATVTRVFSELYGEKASETMYGKAKDLGFNQDEINSMIATNPKAALKVLGVGKEMIQKADPVTSNGGVVAEHFSEKNEEAPKSIMGATNSAKLTDSWKASQALTNKRLGIETP